MRIAKTCSKCRNRIVYPRRGKSFMSELYGQPFKKKLCPECVGRGWRFDQQGKVIHESSLIFARLFSVRKPYAPIEPQRVIEAGE